MCKSTHLKKNSARTLQILETDGIQYATKIPDSSGSNNLLLPLSGHLCDWLALWLEQILDQVKILK